MSLGRSSLTEDLLASCREVCDKLSDTSVYKVLWQHSHRLFPDEAFADLFSQCGRASVPPRIVAVVMVLQRLEGLSDREAVERLRYDLRWKYACGLEFDYEGFAHTVLVDMRARLRGSEHPNRIFDAVLSVAKEGGLIGHKRVLDSTALYDAVATQDTVTMIRAAIRGVLRVAGTPLAAKLRTVLKRDDDYVKAGKPICDWGDKQAREQLIDDLAKDGYALLEKLEAVEVSSPLREAVELLATVLGQDLEETGTGGGGFRIARRVARDRVISTVDPEARHGHKTASRGFDGYKGHIAIDPDSELITATEVTPGNAGDASAAESLLRDVLVAEEVSTENATDEEQPAQAMDASQTGKISDATRTEDAGSDATAAKASDSAQAVPIEVYGDSSYGTADLIERLEQAGLQAETKVQPPHAGRGKFSQDEFEIDTQGGTVRCPSGHLVPLRRKQDGSQVAAFGDHCQGCSLQPICTDAKSGRMIRLHPKHPILAQARARQSSPEWRCRYRTTRPKVERKIAHLMRRKHGGRRARVRGVERVRQDFSLLAAAHNLLRIALLGVGFRSDGPAS